MRNPKAEAKGKATEKVPNGTVHQQTDMEEHQARVDSSTARVASSTGRAAIGSKAIIVKAAGKEASHSGKEGQAKEQASHATIAKEKAI